MQMLKLNHYDHSIAINLKRDNNNKIIAGFCRQFEKIQKSRDIYIYIPKYIQKMIANYHLIQEIYLIRDVQIDNDNDNDNWTFQAWRFPTTILFDV